MTIAKNYIDGMLGQYGATAATGIGRYVGNWLDDLLYQIPGFRYVLEGVEKQAGYRNPQLEKVFA